mgnify:CR=1 FL=1
MASLILASVGSIMCRELTSQATDTLEAIQKARVKLLAARSPTFVRDAAEHLIELGVAI